MFGFFAGVYIGFILLKVFCSLNMNFMFFLVMACGVCMSIGVVAVWIFLAVPVVSVILPTIEVGVIFASIILYLPQTNTISLVTDLNYWLVYICCVLAAPICLLAFTQKAHILSCVLLGTTLTILPVDFYMGTTLRYMFLNIIRRAHVPHYNQAILVPVFQSGKFQKVIIFYPASVTHHRSVDDDNFFNILNRRPDIASMLVSSCFCVTVMSALGAEKETSISSISIPTVEMETRSIKGSG